MITEQRFTNLDSAAASLARDLGDCLAHAIEARGRALVAVSGGRTPSKVFADLRNATLDWSRVTVTLIDERWVPENDPASNAAMVRRVLLSGRAAAATFVPLYGGEPTPGAGANACRSRLVRDAGLVGPSAPLDAAYLGMGEDGHFASLFPGDPEVETADEVCTPVPARDGRVARMSLTAPVLLAARTVYLLYTGPEKHCRYQLAKQQPGPIRELPLRLLFTTPGINLKVLSAP